MIDTTTDRIAEQVEASLYALGQEPEKNITMLDDQRLQIEGETYIVATDYREGFELDAFSKRYQEYFQKFDFIVGDWGYEQLRLRGFYQMNRRQVPRDQQIDYLEDYLREYCNFGCRFFVLTKETAFEKYAQLYQSRLNRQFNQKTNTSSSSNRKENFDRRYKKHNQSNRQYSRKEKLKEDSLSTRVTPIHHKFQDVLDSQTKEKSRDTIDRKSKMKREKFSKNENFQMKQVKQKDIRSDKLKQNTKVDKRSKFTIKQLEK